MNIYFAIIRKTLGPAVQFKGVPQQYLSYMPYHVVQNSMIMSETDDSEIESIISGLNSQNAVGRDSISSSIIKSATDFLTPSFGV